MEETKIILLETVKDATCCTDEEKDLFEAVIDQIGDWETIFEYPEDYANALNGIIGFTYHTETEEFFIKNAENILCCLCNYEKEVGLLDKTDSTIFDWYSWFTLEYIINKVIDYKYNKENII